MGVGLRLKAHWQPYQAHHVAASISSASQNAGAPCSQSQVCRWAT